MNVPDPFSLADWTEAEAMPLRCEPRSAEAAALVNGILAVLVFPPADKPARPTTLARRRKALEALVADLLRLQALGLVGSHGMKRDDFPAKVLGFGFDVFSPLKDALVAAGLLAFRAGKPRWHTAPGFDGTAQIGNLGGWVARFRLTPLALGHVEAAGVALDAWSDHWQRSAPVKPEAAASLPMPPLVVLKASSGWSGGAKRQGEALPVDMGHPMVVASLADLEAHNAFIRDLGVDGIDFLGLRRVFNEGDKPDRLWRSGGRFYSVVSGGVGTRYESMAAADRLATIQLGGRPVGEVDMNASQLRLLYALQDAEWPAGLVEDPYALPGLSRAAVKLVVAQALGKGQPRSKGWGQEAMREYAKRNPGRSLATDHAFTVHQDATLSAHPILKRLGGPGVPSALELQFVESEVLRRAMAMLRMQGVGCLPVHDSLIVAGEHLQEAEMALKSAFCGQVELATGRTTCHRATVSRKASLTLPRGDQSIRR